MAEANKGTDEFDSLEGTSDWYVVREAECIDSLNTLDELFEESTDGSVISNLIDDSGLDEVDQGNTLSLYNQQITDACDNAIRELKRKYVKSPEHGVAALSPKLQAVTISPRRQSKRKLFEDSGVVEDEAPNTLTQVDLNSDSSGKDGASASETVLQGNNRALNLAKFKRHYGISFCELTRSFRSNKSCSDNWVIYVHSAAEEVLESSKLILQQHCVFVQVILQDFCGLYLVEFKTAKSRETVVNLYCTMLNVQEFQVLCEPPKNRNVAAALFFYKKSINKKNFIYGEFPEWLAKQVLVEHQTAVADAFELSVMVQWAYDNDYVEEHVIAYKYAELAMEDKNAAAFLKSNNQVKFVKDCCAMVKMYKRHEMREMSMSAWIWKCCKEHKEDGDWKTVLQFLKYQGVNVVAFLGALRTFLKAVPKKNCMVFWGPPNTGKSYFVYSLLKFLKGKVVSIMNRSSQFWLQPLLETKIGLLDDVTYPAWQFIDINMRNGLDGNSISVDAKHRAPIQFRLPPLFVTTNVNVEAEQSLMYLHSRLVCFHFPNVMPVHTNGDPIYPLTDVTWTCFFRKLYKQLDLTPPEEEGDGHDAERAFCCTAGSSNGTV
ncbi:E1 protein [Human papillomavirus type 220]|uniref:Replication protein E1 n=1 Tax=Human papillomavirus type 220 TaxID=2200957 RepID=A0A2S1ZRV8_9PAPI|nr:E1 protein [Human papillomavirus type 220]